MAVGSNDPAQAHSITVRRLHRHRANTRWANGPSVVKKKSAVELAITADNNGNNNNKSKDDDGYTTGRSNNNQRSEPGWESGPQGRSGSCDGQRKATRARRKSERETPAEDRRRSTVAVIIPLDCYWLARRDQSKLVFMFWHCRSRDSSRWLVERWRQPLHRSLAVC